MNNIYVICSNREYFLNEQGICFVKNLLAEGKSYKYIAKTYLDVNDDTLSNMCKKVGINKDNRRKYSLIFDYFSNIDTPEKAYWLGFLCADGYIYKAHNTLVLELQEKDKDHIEKFKKAINSDYHLKQIKCTLNNKDFIHYRLSIDSVQLVDDLISKGCHQNKSLDLLPPSQSIVNKNLIKYWILGYYDGDGGICNFIDNKTNSIRYKTYITSTKEVLEFIKDYYKINSKIRFEHNCKNTYKIEMTEGVSEKILNDLYDNNSINFCLTRKYNTYIKNCYK